LSEQIAHRFFRGAFDVPRLQFAFALVFGDFLVALAADAFEDFLANLAGIADAADANVNEIDAVFIADPLLQARQGLRLQSGQGVVHPGAAVASRRDADQIVHRQLHDRGAELTVDARPENVPRALRRAEARDESAHGVAAGDL